MTAAFARDLAPDEALFLEEFEETFGPMADRAVRCPRPDLLRAVEGDALPPALASALRRHLERCPLCRALTRDLAELPDVGLDDEQRRRIRTRVLGAPVRRRRRWSAASNWWAGAAAAVAAAAASLVFSASQPGNVRVPAVSAPSRALPPAAARPSVLAPDHADVALPLAAILTMRGERSASVDLQTGLALYHRRDYSGAAERFVRVVPDASLPQLAVYLAVCYLHTGDAAAAERTLDAARGLAGDAIGEAAWYRAVAHAQMGQSARARDEFNRLCREGGPRAMQACAATFELPR
jgi:hypothetical protein